MLPRIDEYAYLNNPLHNWDPRVKMLGMGVLIFAFSFVKSLWLLPLMLMVSILLYYLSALPRQILLNSFKLPGLFIIMLAVILPLFFGQSILIQLGFIAVKKEGCLQLLIITVKFISILTVAIVLFGTTAFQDNVKAMRALGLPQILTDMILFTYRYLFELAAMLKTMETAIRLRGFRRRRLSGTRTYAYLAGTMLVRSYEQSDRVYKAMTLRGYGSMEKMPGIDEAFEIYSRKYGLLFTILFLAVFFVLAQIIYPLP